MDVVILDVELFEMMIGKKNGKEMLQTPVSKIVII